jgi:hypothetical protein
MTTSTAKTPLTERIEDLAEAERICSQFGIVDAAALIREHIESLAAASRPVAGIAAAFAFAACFA